MERITSLQNNNIKNLVKLRSKASERKEQGLFLIEGGRELSLALAGGYAIHSLYIYTPLYEKSDYPSLPERINTGRTYEVSEAVFGKIAYREGSDGIVALARPKAHKLSDLSLPDNPFLIILEAVEKPGNLGAILRTADAAAVDALIVCDPHTDLYNPNVVRSGVGCLFTVPVAVCSNEEALAFLHKKHIRSYAAELEADHRYHQVDYTTPTAIVMGTEADGLTPFWLTRADSRIKIPMRGAIDSLNVSVSTAVITFEAMRQRGFAL